MRILITGSSGQVGTNLGLKCLELGHEVLGTDRRRNMWTNAFDTVVRDLKDPLSGSSELQSYRPDVVVHLAAHAKVNESVLSPAVALENTIVTHQVLEYCRARSTPVVVSSSREVYGDVHRPGSTSEGAADFTLAASPYSASKLAIEAMIYAATRCYGLPALVFRLSNVYGRYDDDLERMERVVPLFIHRIARGESVTLYGPEKVLDFTWIDDCVDGLMRGIERLVDGRLRAETFNLGSSKGHSLGQLVQFIGEAVGKMPHVKVEPTQVGEVTHYVANVDKARRLLGFEPQVVLADGIRLKVSTSARASTMLSSMLQ